MNKISYLIRLYKSSVSINMPKNIRVGRSEILLFFVNFLYADFRAELLLMAHISTKLLKNL